LFYLAARMATAIATAALAKALPAGSLTTPPVPVAGRSLTTPAASLAGRGRSASKLGRLGSLLRVGAAGRFAAIGLGLGSLATAAGLALIPATMGNGDDSFR
jgi:hypothetical protein